MSWFAVSEEGSAERRPTNNGRDPELVGRDSVEPEEAPILSFKPAFAAKDHHALSSRPRIPSRGEGPPIAH